MWEDTQKEDATHRMYMRLFVSQCVGKDSEVRYTEQTSGHQWGGGWDGGGKR